MSTFSKWVFIKIVKHQTMYTSSWLFLQSFINDPLNLFNIKAMLGNKIIAFGLWGFRKFDSFHHHQLYKDSPRHTYLVGNLFIVTVTAVDSAITLRLAWYDLNGKCTDTEWLISLTLISFELVWTSSTFPSVSTVNKSYN